MNSFRTTANSATRVLNKVDSINLEKIGFAAKITAALGASFGAYTAFQNDLGQKRVATALEGIATQLSTIAKNAETKNISYLAGSQGEMILVYSNYRLLISLQGHSLFRSSILQMKSRENKNHASSLPSTPAISQFLPLRPNSSPIPSQDGRISTLKPVSSGWSTIGNPSSHTYFSYSVCLTTNTLNPYALYSHPTAPVS